MLPPGSLNYHQSPLLRLAMHERRLLVWDFLDEGTYPDHQAEKAEIEELSSDLIESWNADDLRDAVERNRSCLAAWFPEASSVDSSSEWARRVAFSEIQMLLEDSRAALELASFGRPRDDQPLFEALPHVYGQQSRDGLFRLQPEHLTDAGGSEMAFIVGGMAVYPDTRLRPLRELLSLLATLVHDPDLAVYVALDPYRITAVDAIPCVLLADQWSGIRLSQENLDSLDAHAVGTTSFHRALNRSKSREIFNPLVATTIDWAARGDDDADPVKRLYIREFLPPRSGLGEPLAAVVNRELHAERDTQLRAFTHVDGKVRRYPTDTYTIDHVSPRGDAGPPSHSRKLWRVDGEIAPEFWSELVGLHFRGNELVAEHFHRVFPAMPS